MLFTCTYIRYWLKPLAKKVKIEYISNDTNSTHICNTRFKFHLSFLLGSLGIFQVAYAPFLLETPQHLLDLYYTNCVPWMGIKQTRYWLCDVNQQTIMTSIIVRRLVQCMYTLRKYGCFSSPVVLLWGSYTYIYAFILSIIFVSYNKLFLRIKYRTDWSKFCRRHLKLHFIDRKFVYSYWNFVTICSWDPFPIRH